MRRSLQSQDGSTALVVLWVVDILIQRTSGQEVHANACDRPAPMLATLRRSDDILSNAEVVYENCTVVRITSISSNGTTMIDASYLGIAAISSFPAVSTIVLSGNQVTTIYEDKEATVKNLDLSANGLSALDALSIPPSVTRLVLDNNSIQSLDRGEIPDSVTTLSIKNNGIFFPTALTLSDSLNGLDTSENPIHDLSKWRMPSKLQAFSCVDCGVEKLSGVSLPSSGSLTYLNLEGSTVDSYEIAESSMPLVYGLGWFKLTVADSNCRDGNASMHSIKSVNVCVLPDTLYNTKYMITGDANGLPSKEALPPSHELAASSNWMLVAMIAGAALLLVVIGGAVGYLVFRHRRLNSRFKNYASESRSDFRSVPEARTTTLPSSNRTFFEWTLTTGNVAAEEQHEYDDTLVGNKRRGMSNTLASSTQSVEPLSLAHVDNDIRNDQDMRHFRLLHEEVIRGKLIAKGGYGAVYEATFRDTIVVIKQLLPERVRDPKMLNNFMDEIRTCASLDHPKIVTFLGFTFSTLVDLSAVFEYMPNGDLATLLHKQLKRESRDPLARDAFGWFRSKMSERGGFQCKSLLALDVAEALVYLHSFESPMIHRDLKSNNVLLSEKWEAKLTDFGVSRELVEDQTMTAEIGTISWIAPEVLRGERYSEKADVYSFGVIMTELDTCRRPYSEGVLNDDNRGGNVKHTNARIAVLVSAGKLRPTLSSDCPNSVRDVVAKCLDADPINRPSALQLHFELRNLELALDDLSTSGHVTRKSMAIRRSSQDRPSYRQKRSRQSKPHMVLVEDNDIALLSNERRDHVQYYV
ncbi:tkl protein kinase [Plasmopara halstedii]|uniref:Tkl protein kinase n=1 Tax=Plasmopara halstedii TaxID=4781 RepID=A0A0P1B0F8_PLAHL|nr:tkl protein kinase [Plasmopara halstedii]CEG47634.1 tkl protein kinase [Plasmopara halstedii]|eukprot:XP_024584003.1 tkl protein kinase [Plasmopara halstedii]